MPPLLSRAPGPAALLAAHPSAPAPYYTLIADGHHLHPSVVALLHAAGRRDRAILVSDSTELASPDLPAGVYPGNAQITGAQRKVVDDPTTGEPYACGPKVVLEREGEEETLVGGAGTLAQGVRNLMAWTGCGVAAAVRTVTENVAAMMGVDGEGGVGVLREGRRADLVVLSEEGEVLQTWVAGRMVWEREGGL